MELEYTYVSSQDEMDKVFDLCAKVIGSNYYEALELFQAIQKYDMHSVPEQWRIAKNPEGEIVAHLGITLKNIRIGKADLSVGGMRDIAIHPDYHDEKPLNRLIGDAIDYLTRSKVDIVMVYGFDYEYENFGFAGVLPEYHFLIPAREAEYLQRKLKFMSFDVKQVKNLNRLYIETYSKVPGHVVRNEAGFLANLKRCKVLENTRRYAVHTFRANSEVGAYIIMENETILEACAHDEVGWETLISFLSDRATADRREYVNLDGLSFSHPLVRHCRRYRHKAETCLRMQGGGMAKILGLRRCLEKMLPEFKARMEGYGFGNTDFICVNVHVGKEKLALVFDSGNVRLEMPMPKAALTVKVDDIGFAQLLFGTLAVNEIADISLKGAEYLAPILFPKNYPQIPRLDRF